MRVSSKMKWLKEKEFANIIMGIFIKVIGQKIKDKDSDLLNMKMEIISKVIGKMINKMEKDFLSMLMEMFFKENLKKIY